MSMAHTKYTRNSVESQLEFNPLPAVVLGGPPHSGKSVLTFSLTQALRERNVPHYVIRAYPPDYEGDWFLSEPQEQVRPYRVKGARSTAWLAPLQRDIARRHLPLLVDLGGLPTADQEDLLDVCTHGILLTPDAAARAAWAERLARRGLVLLADLHSELHGETALIASSPLLRGTLAGLERGARASGPAFAALVESLEALFRPAAVGLRRRHLAEAQAELAVDIQQLAGELGQDAQQWSPAALPDVFDYLPQGRPLALYGRGPNWLYAAIAAHTLPAPFYLFDVRLGWIPAPELAWGEPAADAALTVAVHCTPEVTRLEFHLPDAYLDWEDDGPLRVPPVTTPGLVLSGKLPMWLWAALARHYTAPEWVAVVQPSLAEPVVVRGRH